MPLLHSKKYHNICVSLFLKWRNVKGKKEQIYWIQKQFVGRFQQFTRRLKFIRSDVDLIETEGTAQGHYVLKTFFLPYSLYKMFSKENLTNSFISDPKTNWIVKTMITQQALVMRAKKTAVTTTLILVEIPMKNENGKEIRL